MHTHFAADYATARALFQETVLKAGGRVRSFTIEDYFGPHGETLTTDVGWLGPSQASAALIVTSGTHGIEGYAGSAVQIGIAQSLADALEAAVLLVHAINPYGFAHGRRVNEHNVDLNRNFIDFAHPPCTGSQYASLHPMLVPSDWEGEARRFADEALAKRIDELGIRRYQQIVCEGQYAFADGLFYGGREPARSNRIWRRILAQLPACVSCVGHIDVHTGLGPFGYGEVLYTLPAEGPALELAREWYGSLGLQLHGAETSVATDVVGTMNRAVLDLGTRARVCSVSLEFGTVALDRMIDAVRADNWLHLHGDPHSPLGKAIKHELRECFCPDDAGWRAAVVQRGLEVCQHALSGLLRCTRKS